MEQGDPELKERARQLEEGDYPRYGRDALGHDVPRVSFHNRAMSLKKFVPLLIGASALFASGCSTPQFVGRPGLTTVRSGNLPAPRAEDLQTEAHSALVGPGDELSVDVFGLPEISRTVRVDASGRIAIPLAGSVEAANHTVEQLTSMLEDRLRANAVRDPKVTLNIVNSVSQAVTVDGAVKTPGEFAIAGSTTLMRTIARGGGVTEFAKENHVVVFRRVNGQDMVALYDLRAIRLGMYKDPPIYANDIVLVGESNARRVFSQVLQASGLLSAPIIALIQKY